MGNKNQTKKEVTVFVIILALILAAITVLSIEPSNDKIINANEMELRFVRHQLDKNYSILEDRETGVCYLEYIGSNGYRGYYGITVMINPDGTPKTWGD